MRKKLVVLSATILLVLGMAGGAYAVGLSQKTSTYCGNRWQSLITQLNATDKQLSEWRALRSEFFEQTQDLRNRLQKARFELSNLYLQKNPDQAQIQAKQAEIQQLCNQLQQKKNEEQQKMSQIFTKEQLDKIGQNRGFGLGMGFGRRGCFRSGNAAITQ